MHATCIQLGSCGVLLRGPSGSGKSDLALRLIGAPAPLFAPAGSRAVLVADDRVCLEAVEGRLVASAPDFIAGKLEVRGVGIIDAEYQASAEIRLLVDLMRYEDVQRMPLSPPPFEDVQGIRLPCLSLDPFEASARHKLWLAVASLG